MDKEEEAQLAAPKETQIAAIAQENDEITESGLLSHAAPDQETSPARTAQGINNAPLRDQTRPAPSEDPVKEAVREAELPDPFIAPIETKVTGSTVPSETATELVTEGPRDPSDAPPVPSTVLSAIAVASGTQNPEEDTKEIKHAKEGSKEAELPDPSVTATPDSSTHARPGTETLEEDEGVQMVKEEIKGPELACATPVAASDVRPIAEPSEETKDAEPDHEEEIKEVELSQETPATETVDEPATLKPEAMLPKVETEGPKIPDTSVAETGEEENKETVLIKEEVNKSELPDSSLAAATVIDAELTPDSKTTEVATVVDVHSEKERASGEVKVEHADATESAGAESEVAEVLPEKKKKKKPLGDHLAEEKVNDSVNATKQTSDENSESELPEPEQLTGTVAPKESTEISARDAISIIKADEKEEDKQAVENAAGKVTATEVAQEGNGEKIAERESVVAPAEAAKEDVASKLTSRSSNNILSKVKHQIVKVRKAIVRKSPSSKNMPVENKDDFKVK